MPKRRFEKIELKNQTVILDYAHHPKEIETIYDTLTEQYKDKRKISLGCAANCRKR
jgi:UDP-N-acetylmuramate-alanine ligase